MTTMMNEKINQSINQLKENTIVCVIYRILTIRIHVPVWTNNTKL
jgi:hypothetical protein